MPTQLACDDHSACIHVYTVLYAYARRVDSHAVPEDLDAVCMRESHPAHGTKSSRRYRGALS